MLHPSHLQMKDFSASRNSSLPAVPGGVKGSPLALPFMRPFARPEEAPLMERSFMAAVGGPWSCLQYKCGVWETGPRKPSSAGSDDPKWKGVVLPLRKFAVAMVGGWTHVVSVVRKPWSEVYSW